MSEFSLYVDESTVAAAAQATEPLSMPDDVENPSFVAGKKEGAGSWTESLKIEETSLNAKDGDPDTGVFFISFTVTDKASAKNAGRTYRYYEYLDKKALFDPKHEMHRWNQQRLNRINSLLRAFGVEPPYKYEDYFNGEKPLIGQEVNAKFSRYSSMNKKSQTAEWRLSLDAFFAG